MADAASDPAVRTLLVFNCHESWVYQLGALGYPLDITVGLKGRYTALWDEQIRPIPENSRMISLTEAQRTPKSYYCIIAHNITDLLDIKHRPEPKLLVVHATLEGQAHQEKTDVTLGQMTQTMHQYIRLVKGHVVSVSRLKGISSGFTEDIVTSGADPKDYRPYTGEKPCGLRISNFINHRRRILMWDFHNRAFQGLPVQIVGHNPDMPGVSASENWAHLKRLFQVHRFYIHTADPEMEDGFNMATIEAMAAGMPVLGNRHHSSPIEHGVSGFLSDDPESLRRYARMLLDDRDLAVQMGREAQKIVVDRFSMERFRTAFARSIETARAKGGV